MVSELMVSSERTSHDLSESFWDRFEQQILQGTKLTQLSWSVLNLRPPLACLATKGKLISSTTAGFMLLEPSIMANVIVST